ncbi:hypothetical protein RHSIM_Rhsim07G0089300 [Rhododendron simsii]|uniref:DNA topoisomerase (ATP-hydrolyzing) n=1 Tax=Rhododendron simsii TaxID=118357 RepID=A0A834GQD9_RHOSS|nr:hypothetical protein RHSIM_Rhsim07G0089300 [Rhododendron simsii]
MHDWITDNLRAYGGTYQTCTAAVPFLARKQGLVTVTWDPKNLEHILKLSHRKDFIWEDEQDGEAIQLAFSKKKIEARKNWLRHYKPGIYLDQKEKLIKYRDFVNKELILFSMADL